jgi:hypothetical protein
MKEENVDIDKTLILFRQFFGIIVYPHRWQMWMSKMMPWDKGVVMMSIDFTWLGIHKFIVLVPWPYLIFFSRALLHYRIGP